VTAANVKMQQEVADLAWQFNVEAGRAIGAYRVYVRQAELSRFYFSIPDSAGNGVFPKGEPFLLERFISGAFTRFNSNTGWTSRQEVPDAFSHWTWVCTHEQKLVCDLQGTASHGQGAKFAKDTHYYLFTDPAVNSATGEDGGLMDLGYEGIQTWFSQHRCNGICKALDIHKRRPPAQQLLAVVKESSYSSVSSSSRLSLASQRTTRSCVSRAMACPAPTIAESDEESDDD